MTARPKFLFDTDFSAADSGRYGGASSAQQQAALAEAETRGYRTGLAAGKEEAAAETERRRVQALERCGSQLAAIAAQLASIEARIEADALDVAVAVAGKLSPALIEREPLAEVSALAADCLRQLVNAPHVVVRVNEAMSEATRADLARVAEGCSFGGRLIVMSESDIAYGDCRIEWADGGVVRSRADVEAVISDLVRRYIEGRDAASKQTTESAGA